VKKVDDCIGDAVAKATAELKNGEVRGRNVWPFPCGWHCCLPLPAHHLWLLHPHCGRQLLRACTASPRLLCGFPGSQVLLLENVRFYPEEEKNDAEFAKKLAANADM